MRIIYYVNQFFGGIGAEEHAGAPVEFRDGAWDRQTCSNSCLEKRRRSHDDHLR